MSNGETVDVPAGAVVVGGAGGGTYVVNGVSTPIAAGATAVAGSSGDDNPGDQQPTDPGETTLTTTTTSSRTSSTSSTESSTKASSTTPASSTAAPSSTATAEYIIYPKDGTTTTDANGFNNTLVGLVGASNVDPLLDANGTVLAWLAPLNAEQLSKVKADGVVDAVESNEMIDPDPEPEPASSTSPAQRRAVTTQVPTTENPSYELRFLSSPYGHKGLQADYRYDDVAGEGITIYVIDSGPFNLEHTEFEAPDNTVTRRSITVSENPDDGRWHGTCVASKAVGKTTGSAKRASLVVVHIDMNLFSMLKGYAEIAHDIIEGNLQGKAVLSSSVAQKMPEASRTTSMFRRIITQIIKLDVPVICAAGNDGAEVTEVNMYPGLFASELPVTVVGATDDTGYYADFTQRGSLVSTYAVGEDILCADIDTTTALRTSSGTSFAAPLVAGLAAYWMSLADFSADLRSGSVAADMRQMIEAFSYARLSESGAPELVWNGYQLQDSCSGSSSSSSGGARRRGRRDISEACSYMPSTAPPTSATAAPTSSTAGLSASVTSTLVTSTTTAADIPSATSSEVSIVTSADLPSITTSEVSVITSDDVPSATSDVSIVTTLDAPSATDDVPSAGTDVATVVTADAPDQPIATQG